MSELTYHVRQRLDERGIKVNFDQLRQVIRENRHKQVGICLDISDFKGQNYGSHHERQASNGQMTILIVRFGVVVTVMFRRLDQNKSPQAMSVDSIVDLTGRYWSKR